MTTPYAFTIELPQPLAAAIEPLCAARQIVSASLRRVIDRLAAAG